jgi:iron complex outermembrane receptor protein
MNLAVDVTNQLTFRIAAAKVLARPDLPELSPGTSIQPNTRTASVGNPFLEPTRAKTLDIAAEWYFQPGSLLAISYFYKDIDSYTQAITRSIPFSETGFPSSLLAGQPVGPEDIFVISSRLNTPGGPLRGVEINYQQQFSFLPSFLKNVGLLANYTRVTSDINYILNQATGVTAEFPLVGLSKNQANATLYYEDSKFSIRSSINYRSSSLRQVPSGSSSPGSDVDLIAPTTFVDASASYSLTDQIRLTLEASNLTDEHTIYYVDSRRKDVLYNVHSGRTFTVGVSFKL